MLIVLLIGLAVASFLLGWKTTARRERARGYAAAVEDQLERIKRVTKNARSRKWLRVLKGGKR